MDDFIETTALTAMQAMLDAGFSDVQVCFSTQQSDELSISHNEASMLRSTEEHNLSMIGVLDSRRASTTVTDISTDSIKQQIIELLDSVSSAPKDSANTVSENQHGRVERGPLNSNLDLMAEKVSEILDFRAAQTPRFTIEEGGASHTLIRSHTVSSRGTALSAARGHYSLSVMGTATDGARSSSLNYCGGDTHELAAEPAPARFGIQQMMRETVDQIETRSLDAKFTGDVILTPQATSDLLSWVLGQVGDLQLISGSSLYQQRVNQPIASSRLSIRSRFDGAGVSSFSEDGYQLQPLTLIEHGVLKQLLPSRYGSLKTGLAHVPSAYGWEIAGGEDRLQDILSSVTRGALVGRLSMGSPAANGDFSGVIKNSFLLQDGQRGEALSEVMITGNVARMLEHIEAISRERMDTGATLLPWFKISGLHFS